MLIAWTTVPTRVVADELASGAITAHLAACVQVEGPIVSHFFWAGAQERAEEYRLTFKAMPSQIETLKTWVHDRHPYELPEWIVVKAEHVSEKYLSWAQASSTYLPL